MLRTPFTLVILFFSLIGTAICQKSIATLITGELSGNTVTSQTHQDLIDRLNKQRPTTFMMYQKVGDDINFVSGNSADQQEKACELLLSYRFDIFENYSPKLQIQRPKPKEGEKADPNAIKVFFTLPKEAFVGAKLINLETNEIEGVHVRQLENACSMAKGLDNTEQAGLFYITDYKAYFKGDPDVLKKKNYAAYEKSIDLLHLKYKPKFEAFFQSKKVNIGSEVLSCVTKFLVPGPLPIESGEIENDKAKRLVMDLGGEIKVPNYSYLKVFTLDTIGDYLVPEKYGNYTVREYSDGKHYLNSGLFSKPKKVAELLSNNRKLYASMSSAGYSEKLNVQKELLTIGVNFGELSLTSIENKLSEIARLKLIDLGSIKIVNQFREKYKQEIFIDDDFSAKAMGAKYLLLFKDKDIQITDVETGQIVDQVDKNEGVKGIYDSAMELFDLEIEVVNITKQKKDKIKKLRLYSPLGFDGSYYLNVYEIKKEKVGDEILERPIEIAICRFMTDESTVVEAIVYKGEKELYEAIQNNAVLKFRNRAFKFFGNTYK